MENIADHIAHIVKVGDDLYHLVIRNGSRLIDAEVDGALLVATLAKEQMIGVTVGELIHGLHNQEIGYRIIVQLHALDGP